MVEWQGDSSVAKWKIGDGNKGAVEDLISGSRLKKHAAIARACNLHPNTIGRFLAGAWIEEATLKTLVACLLDFPAGRLTAEQQKAVGDTIKATCEPKPEEPKRQPMKNQPDAAATNNTLASIVYYSKCLHLRHKRNEREGYAYQKLVPGNRLENVFSEFLAVRSYTFHHTQPGMDFEGNCTGIVTLLPTFPPRADNNDNRIDTANFMQHIKYLEDEPGRFYQSAITYINGFLLENETAGVRLVQHCDRASLIVDFSSLPAGLVAICSEAIRSRSIFGQAKKRPKRSKWIAAGPMPACSS